MFSHQSCRQFTAGVVFVSSAPRATPPKTLDHSERARPNDAHRLVRHDQSSHCLLSDCMSNLHNGPTRGSQDKPGAL